MGTTDVSRKTSSMALAKFYGGCRNDHSLTLWRYRASSMLMQTNAKAWASMCRPRFGCGKPNSYRNKAHETLNPKKAILKPESIYGGPSSLSFSHTKIGAE